ncbi:MAG: tRNA dihydrouridine(20/20a) synthase DusA [Methylococcales bacterium]
MSSRKSPGLLSIAPMLACTDRHFRYLARIISRHIFLYSEMIVTGALLHGDSDKLLAHHPSERPVAMQLGGSDPKQLAVCAEMVEEAGYNEVNLNIGCPSEKVLQGRFGACLLAEPDLVAECVAAMVENVSIPVTVKTRIGIDNDDSYERLAGFIDSVSAAGCNLFIVHARKAWLNGLSPKQNREVPPLKYDTVYRVKQDFPDLDIVINGGITTLEQAKAHLESVNGVMMGREIYQNPYILAGVDSGFYEDYTTTLTRIEVLDTYIGYVQDRLSEGYRFNSMARHLLGLFHGVNGARAWRRYLSDNIHRAGVDEKLLQIAVDKIR